MEITGSFSKPLIQSYAPYGNKSITNTIQKLLTITITYSKSTIKP